MTREYKLIKESDNPLKMEKDLIEVQKTIIYFGTEILQKLADIEKTLKREPMPDTSKYRNESITTHLAQIKIPDGYKGNNLKW